MRALLAGTATAKGQDGADWWLKHYGKLPKYYLSKEEARKLGWSPQKGNLNWVAPGKMITGGVYHNDNGKLPDKLGRVWYEADIDYTSGYRKDHRILFSNDGLIFITYNHYETFYEIV